MKIVCVRLPEPHVAALLELAHDDERTFGFLLRRIVRQYLENEPPVSRITTDYNRLQRSLEDAPSP